MRRLLLLVCAIVLVDTMLYAALVPLLHDYTEDFDLSKAGAGVLVATYPAGALLAALPGGLAAARLGPKTTVLGGLALLSLASLGFAMANSEWTIGLARFLQGVGSAFSWAGGLAWLVAGTPRERRGEMLGTAVGSAVFGALLGPALGAGTQVTGPGVAFAAVAVLGMALMVWAWRVPGAPTQPQRLGMLVGALRDRVVLGAIWLMVLPALLFGVLVVLVPLALGDAGWGRAAIGAVFVGSAAAEVAVSPLVGRVSDRRGRLLPVRLALAASIATALALALADAPVAIVPLVVAAAIAFGAFWAPALALLSNAAERLGLAQGLAFGLMNVAWGVGATAGPSFGGALADAAGNAPPYVVMAGICFATLLAARSRKLVGTPEWGVPETP
jgi:MFS family permease